MRNALSDARAYSDSGDGSASGCHGVAGGGGSISSGVWPWMAVIISTPDLPSTAAWWTLSTKPKQPSGSALDVVEALDDVQLPQRLREVERAGVQARRLDAELPPVARAGQGDLAHVVLEVELGVLHPVRVIQISRDAHDLLAERTGQVQAGLEVVEHVGELTSPPGRRGRVVDADRRDVRRCMWSARCR